MSNLKFKWISLIIISLTILLRGANILTQDIISRDKIPNVIIITLDGVRNSETIKDPTHQYIPNLWEKIFKQGVLYTNLVCVDYEFHMPIIHAINSGVSGPFFSESLQAPSIFQYVRKKYSLPENKLWSIGHWSGVDYALKTDEYSYDTYPCPLSLFSLQIPPELFNELTKQEQIFWKSYSEVEKKMPEKWPNWDSIGKFHFSMVKRIIQKFKPKLIHYNMSDVEAAHPDTFGKYVCALKECDKAIFELWELIQKDPFYKDNTYLIINIDHERDLYYMPHTENNPGISAPVWMYVYGPGIKKGVTINRPVYHIDIFATVTYIMGVETHATKGNILKDCFVIKKGKIIK